MNLLPGTIQSIHTHGNLSLVTIGVGDILLKSIIIEKAGSVSYLKVGYPVKVLFKESEVVIGKSDPLLVSMQNRIPVIIRRIEVGVLMSRLVLESRTGDITSIITSDAVRQLDLRPGDPVTAMIKTNEIMLSE